MTFSSPSQERGLHLPMDTIITEVNIADQPSRVKIARLERGWSKAQLAREADLSDRTVTRSEKGLSISEVSQSRLARALGKRIEDLFPSNGV
jgi:DNA-binding XRE family transcriptional regulator